MRSEALTCSNYAARLDDAQIDKFQDRVGFGLRGRRRRGVRRGLSPVALCIRPSGVPVRRRPGFDVGLLGRRCGECEIAAARGRVRRRWACSTTCASHRALQRARKAPGARASLKTDGAGPSGRRRSGGRNCVNIRQVAWPRRRGGPRATSRRAARTSRIFHELRREEASRTVSRIAVIRAR